MKKTMLLSLLSGVLFILTMESCVKKILGWDGNYTIQGKLLKNCGGEPITNYPLKLVYYGGFNNSDYTEWVSTTDTNGNFSFTIPVNRNKNLEIYHDIYTIPWGGGIMPSVPPQNGDTVNWGAFYEKLELTTNLKIEIKLNNSLSDTLYIGMGGSYQILHPITNVAFFSFNQTYSRTQHIDSLTNTYYWGIGKSFYDSLTRLPKPSNWEFY